MFIIGCGGFGREVYGLICAQQSRNQRWKLAGFLDDNPTAVNMQLVVRLGSAIIGPVSLLAKGGMAAVVAIGSPPTRRSIVEMLGGAGVEWPFFVHPDTTIGTDVRIAEGVVIAPGARLSTNVEVAAHVHVDQNATVGHDSQLEKYSRLNPQACVSGGVKVGEGAVIGASATILPGLKVGSGAVVGAGAVVVRDVEEYTVVKGVPAR